MTDGDGHRHILTRRLVLLEVAVGVTGNQKHPGMIAVPDLHAEHGEVPDSGLQVTRVIHAGADCDVSVFLGMLDDREPAEVDVISGPDDFLAGTVIHNLKRHETLPVPPNQLGHDVLWFAPKREGLGPSPGQQFTANPPVVKPLDALKQDGSVGLIKKGPLSVAGSTGE